jgi:hypothetical protein
MPTYRQYPVERSPLFKLQSKSKLSKILGITPSVLTRLSKNPSFKTFPQKDAKGKVRNIEQPTGQLLIIHKRIQSLLRRLESPSYLFSGKKGLSYLDNAKPHTNNNHFLFLDIAKFYPSTKKEYVFRFFHFKMLMSENIAWLLADLITYKGHIPTGSQLSQSIAYWSYSKLFDDVFHIAQSNDIVFTLYVDDISFSSDNAIPKSFEQEVIHRIYSTELAIKESKLKRGSKKHFKVVTGVAITPMKTITIPNKQRKKIRNAIKSFQNAKTYSLEELTSLIGRIEAARRIEPSFCEVLYPKLKSLRNNINKES